MAPQSRKDIKPSSLFEKASEIADQKFTALSPRKSAQQQANMKDEEEKKIVEQREALMPEIMSYQEEEKRPNKIHPSFLNHDDLVIPQKKVPENW